MNGHMDGWDWVLGSLMMLSWVIVLGIVIYVAVRLANRDSHKA